MADLPPPLDAAMFGQLKELEEGAPGFLKDLVRQFLEQAVRQRALIGDVIRARDCESLLRAAHLLKGSAGSLGALPLMELFRSLETAGGNRAWEDAEGLLPRIDAELARVRTALETA